MKAYRRGLHPRAVVRARSQVMRHRAETGPALPPEPRTELERLALWHLRHRDALKKPLVWGPPWV